MKKNELTDIYIETIKKAVIGSIYEKKFFVIQKNQNSNFKSLIKNKLLNLAANYNIGLIKYEKIDKNIIDEGKYWPDIAYSMLGQKRIDNVQYCCETAIKEQIPGDFIECGVWRGGTTIFMKAILKAYSIKDRTVWVADSFEGLPKPDANLYPADAGDTHFKIDLLKVSINEVKRNFEIFNLLDENVKFLKGWFKDSLPEAPITKISVLRLDGDIYESTWDSLIYLYPKLADNGFLIIDDYYNNESCKKAVNDYFEKNNIKANIIRIDWTGAYCRNI